MSTVGSVGSPVKPVRRTTPVARPVSPAATTAAKAPVAAPRAVAVAKPVPAALVKLGWGTGGVIAGAVAAVGAIGGSICTVMGGVGTLVTAGGAEPLQMLGAGGLCLVGAVAFGYGARWCLRKAFN